MYQLSLNTSDIAELAQHLEHAASKDIRWIEWRGERNDDVLDVIENFCRENGIILTVVDDVNLLEDKRFHGILVTKNPDNIPEWREKLGGHPIIGVEISVDSDWRKLRGYDVDYIVLNLDRHSQEETIKLAGIIKDEWNVPIVARGTNISPESGSILLESNFNGICFLNTNSLINFLGK